VEKVVVTGVGMVTSLGGTPTQTYRALLDGCSGICPISDFDTRGFACRMGAQVPAIDPREVVINPRDARIMGIQGLMLIKASRDAFADANLNRYPVNGESMGLFIGMGMVDYNLDDLLPAVQASLNSDGTINNEAFFSRGYGEIYPLWPLSLLSNMALCQVAIRLGIKGENAVFAAYGDAGAKAIHEGVNTIMEGKAEAVLAGGVSEIISPLSLARNLSLELLNIDRSLNCNACIPFNSEGKGTILGEGCGVMLLESHSSAEKRGARALAEVSGFGSAFERGGEKAWPTTPAVQKAMESSMINAGVDPACVDLIIAHGEGTAGDNNEKDAICRCFSVADRTIDVYASKGALGNLFAASPVVDAILGIQMMENGVVPPAYPDHSTKNPMPFNLICHESLRKRPECILINTRSHQGHCGSLVITACREKRV